MNIKVTVLMSVYNSEKYLRKAVESILNQTFRDFEFLVINDGSTDKSVEIIESYNDPRIKLIHNEKNIGLAASLNKAIDLTNSEYIARMDADDISLPHRLEKQVEFMETHPEIGVCGSWLKVIGSKSWIQKYPTDSEHIKANLIFSNSLAHPSVIFRRKLFIENNLYYDESLKAAQDYDLWARASKSINFANIGEVLVEYRLHENQIGQANKIVQDHNTNVVQLYLLNNLGIVPDDEEIKIHRAINNRKYEFSKDYLNKIENWLLKLKLANRKITRYQETSFDKILATQWFIVCKDFARSGIFTWKKFHNSPLKSAEQLPCIEVIKYWMGLFKGIYKFISLRYENKYD